MTQGTEEITAAIGEQAGLLSVDTTHITTPPEYIVIENLTEQTKASHFVCTPGELPLTSVGDTAIYADDIFNADKEIVGHTVGMARVVEKREKDGHVITLFEEVVQLEDGIMQATGLFDRNNVLTGECVRLKLEGLTGRYAGMSGFREWQLLPPLVDSCVLLRMVLAG